MQHTKILSLAVFTVSVLVFTIVQSDNSTEFSRIEKSQLGTVSDVEHPNMIDKFNDALQFGQSEQQFHTEFTVAEQIRMNKILDDIETRLIMVENMQE